MSRARCFRRRASVLLALLAAGCDGAPYEEGLPPRSGRVPGNCVIAAFAADAGAELTFDVPAELAERFGLRLREDVPGFVVATAPTVPMGWDSLADSAPFQAAWEQRRELARGGVDAWLYCDLQGLVDHGLLWLETLDPRLQKLAEPLALSTLEWALAAMRREPDGSTTVHGRLHASRGEVGVVSLLGSRGTPSLLGPRTEGEQLRVELNARPRAAHRALEAWLSIDDGRGALSMRNAFTDAFARIWRRMLDQVDGRASLVVDAQGQLQVAIGLRSPDDTRDLLDRFFRPHGHDVWALPNRRRAVVEGDRLLVLGPDRAVPSTGGTDAGAPLTVDFDDGASSGRIEVTRVDAATLAIRARLD